MNLKENHAAEFRTRTHPEYPDTVQEYLNGTLSPFLLLFPTFGVNFLAGALFGPPSDHFTKTVGHLHVLREPAVGSKP